MCSYLYAYDNIRIRVLLAYGTRMRSSLIFELHCSLLEDFRHVNKVVHSFIHSLLSLNCGLLTFKTLAFEIFPPSQEVEMFLFSFLEPQNVTRPLNLKTPKIWSLIDRQTKSSKQRENMTKVRETGFRNENLIWHMSSIYGYGRVSSEQTDELWVVY